MINAPGRTLALACSAMSMAIVVAACGSSSSAHAGGGRDYSAFVHFAACMRAHGVPNFPDPSTAGGGVNIDPTGIDPASPAFQAGMMECKQQLPGGGPTATGLTESQKLRQLRFARCMRAHGVSNFPDPSSAGGHGQVLPDINTPGFQQAVKACEGARNGPL